MSELTPQRLAEAASAVAERYPDTVLMKNAAGNLCVIRKDDEEGYLGWIDLTTGDVEFFEMELETRE